MQKRRKMKKDVKKYAQHLNVSLRKLSHIVVIVYNVPELKMHK